MLSKIVVLALAFCTSSAFAMSEKDSTVCIPMGSALQLRSIVVFTKLIEHVGESAPVGQNLLNKVASVIDESKDCKELEVKFEALLKKIEAATASNNAIFE